MRIGTTFFEKYIPHEKYITHLEHLSEMGFCHIEFSPHPNLIALNELKQLQLHAQHLHMSTAFHSPDFLDPAAFQVGLFKSQGNVKQSYAKLLNWIVEEADGSLRYPLVIHSANPTLSDLSLNEATQVNLLFFDWIANEVSRQGLPIDICLENTCAKDTFGTVQGPESLVSFFTQMKGAPVSLCLDLPHWWRQCQLEKKAPELLLDADNEMLFNLISYAHLHGIDVKSEKSHLCFKSEHSPFLDFVKVFSTKKTQINFNLEIFEVADFVNFSSYESLLFEQFQLVNGNVKL